MNGPCMCGDTYCPTCGPLQGNSRCPNCGAWSADGGCQDPAACARDLQREEALMAREWMAEQKNRDIEGGQP